MQYAIVIDTANVEGAGGDVRQDSRSGARTETSFKRAGRAVTQGLQARCDIVTASRTTPGDAKFAAEREVGETLEI